jgi:acyl carrier protein
VSSSTRDAVQAALRNAFRRIAPEVDFDGIDARQDLREQVDLDSVDLLNLLVALEEELGVGVPETDYEEISTLEGLLQYLVSHVAEET